MARHFATPSRLTKKNSNEGQAMSKHSERLGRNYEHDVVGKDAVWLQQPSGVGNALGNAKRCRMLSASRMAGGESDAPDSARCLRVRTLASAYSHDPTILFRGLHVAGRPLVPVTSVTNGY